MIYYLTSHISTILSINLILLVTFFILNFVIPILIARNYGIDYSITTLIILGNFIFFLIYILFENSQGTDSLGWYRKPYHNDMVEFGIRNEALIKIASLYKILGINYLNLALSLNVLSSMTFLIFYIKVREFYFFKNIFYFLIFFMLINSGILFWGNSLLKENFIFFGMSLFLLSISKNEINYKILLLSIIILFIFRPFISFILIVSLVLFINGMFILGKNIRNLILFNIVIMLPVFVITIFIFKQYNFEFSLNFFNDLINRVNSMKASNTSYYDGALTISLDETTTFKRYIMYYFYPLKLTINPLYLLITIQNLFNFLLICVFFLTVFLKFKLFLEFVKKIKYYNILFIYILIYNSFVPLTSYNLGISLRQKWMLLIISSYLIFYFFDFIFDKTRKNRSEIKKFKTDIAKN